MARALAGDAREHRRLVVDRVATLVLAGDGGAAGVGGVAVGGVVVALAPRADRQVAAGGHRAGQQHLAGRADREVGVEAADLRCDAIAGKAHARTHRRTAVDRQHIAAGQADRCAGPQGAQVGALHQQQGAASSQCQPRAAGAAGGDQPGGLNRINRSQRDLAGAF